MKRMRRGLIIFAALALVGVCLWLVVRNTGPYEPIYQGRRLGYWLKLDAKINATLDDRIAAETAFRALDTNAIPFLVARLERDAIWISRKTKFDAWAQKFHIPLRFNVVIPVSHWGGQLYLSEETALSSIGEPATPGLLRVFEETSDTNALNVAAETLWKCQASHDWRQFVNEQKKTMSPTAWRRLNKAWFEELML